MLEAGRRLRGQSSWHLESEETLDPGYENESSLSLALFCRHQTAGRGQTTPDGPRVWQSGPGHVHLSLCFRGGAEAGGALACGQVLAEFLAGMLGFPPTLIWPNDLMVDGKKIAGILCESLQVASDRYLIVGIGLNIHGENIPPQACYLNRWIQGSADARQVAASITETFLSRPAQWLEHPIAGSLSQYMPQKGLLMVREVGQDGDGEARDQNQDRSHTYLWQGLDHRGHMVVRSLCGDDWAVDGAAAEPTTSKGLISFASSYHAPKFAFIRASKVPCIWMEAGHSRLKAEVSTDWHAPQRQKAWRLEDILSGSGEVSSGWIQELSLWVGGGTEGWTESILPVYLAESGDRDFLQALIAALRSASQFELVLVTPKTLRLRLPKISSAQMGFDRICFLEGILASNYLAHCSDWFMAVSFGTAVTVDFCTRGGEFLGGAIMPGHQLAAAGLRSISSLAHLKADLKASTSSSQLALSSEEAIRAGLMAEKLGAVGYMFHHACGDFDGDLWPQIYVQGGGWSQFRDGLGPYLEAILAGLRAETRLPLGIKITDDISVMSGIRILAMSGVRAAGH